MARQAPLNTSHMAPYEAGTGLMTPSVDQAWNQSGPTLYYERAAQQLNNYQRAVMDTAQYRAMEQLQLYVPPTLLALGTLGNLLALATLLQRHLRTQHSACYYLALLAGVHTLVLHMGCGLQWLSRVGQLPHIANLADWVCKIWQFLFTTLQYSCSWLVVLFALDRYILLWYPLRAPYFCTVFTAKLLTVAVYIGLGVICIHAMWTYELQPGNTCTIDPQRRDFETVAWPWVLATVCSYIPQLLVLVLLVLLAVGLASCTNCSRGAGGEQQADPYTRPALLLSAAHFLCSMPAILINFVEYFNPQLYHCSHTSAKLFLAKEVGQELNCLYLALTFIVYFASVPLIRGELAGLCGKHVLRRRAAASATSSHADSGEELEGNPRGKLLLSVSKSGPDSNITQSTFV